MKNIIPLFLIIASIGLFVFFTNKQYQAVKKLQTDIGEYDKALGRSKDILKKRQELQDKYKEFTGSDLKSLEKLLPNHVDNVQLVLDINGIAKIHNMTVSKVKVADEQGTTKNVPLGPNTKPYASILVSFKTKGSYEDFVGFMKDLEKALRITDITNLSFKTAVDNSNEYSVTIKTYWLK